MIKIKKSNSFNRFIEIISKENWVFSVHVSEYRTENKLVTNYYSY